MHIKGLVQCSRVLSMVPLLHVDPRELLYPPVTIFAMVLSIYMKRKQHSKF